MPFARFHPWFKVGGGGGERGDGGLLFHIILSKTVGSITSRCSGIRAVTGKIKNGTQGTAEIEPRKHPSSLSKQSTSNGKRNCSRSSSQHEKLIAWQVKIFNLYMRNLLRRRPGAVESVIGPLRPDDRYSNKNVKKQQQQREQNKKKTNKQVW